MTNPNDPIVTAALAGGTVERSSDAAAPGLEEALSAAKSFGVSEPNSMAATVEDDPFSVRLYSPVQMPDGQKVSELRLKALKVSDMQSAQDQGLQGSKEAFFYVVRCTGLSPECVQKMDVWDYEAVCIKVSSFLDSTARPFEITTGG